MASATAFAERARQIGVSEEFATLLKEAGFGTYGALAFAVPQNATQQDEQPFLNFLKRINGDVDLSEIETACMRRLFYESHTLALSDLKQRVEAGPDQAQQVRKPKGARRSPNGDNLYS